MHEGRRHRGKLSTHIFVTLARTVPVARRLDQEEMEIKIHCVCVCVCVSGMEDVFFVAYYLQSRTFSLHLFSPRFAPESQRRGEGGF